MSFDEPDEHPATAAVPAAAPIAPANCRRLRESPDAGGIATTFRRGGAWVEILGRCTTFAL